MTTKWLDPNSPLCWLCARVVGSSPDAFNVIFIDGEDDSTMICVDPCEEKANILIEHKFKKASE